MLNRRQFATVSTAALLTGCATTQSKPEIDMITHSVFFKLMHEKGSDAETVFLVKGATLADLPGVKNFQVLNETSPKNNFDFGFSMEFSDQQAYDTYSSHPEHVRFVQEIWLKEVAEFQEIDYVQYRK